MTPEREKEIREAMNHLTVDHSYPSDIDGRIEPQAPVSVRQVDELLAEIDALREENKDCRLRILTLETLCGSAQAGLRRAWDENEKVLKEISQILPVVDAKMAARFSPWPDFFCREYACKKAAEAFRALIQEAIRKVEMNDASKEVE